MCHLSCAFTCFHDEGYLSQPLTGTGESDGCILIISGTAFDAWRAALAYKMEGNMENRKTIPPTMNFLATCAFVDHD
jgi:hypothetical protein